mgnify:CR=1 FL=1
MDGLLIDTERKSRAAWQSAATSIGKTLTNELYLDMVGRTTPSCLQVLEEAFGCDLKNSGFHQKVEHHYYTSIFKEGIEVKTGVPSLLQELRIREIPRAVATSTNRQIALRKLRITELDTFFAVVCSGEDVARSKPFPDVFLAAAEAIGVAPERCLVLEDSFAGVRAAHAAGMAPIMIPDLRQPDSEIEALAFHIFPTMSAAADTIVELVT